MENLKRYDDNDPIGTIFVRDIDRLDCASFDPSKGIIGQSWHIDIKISGYLSESPFVYEFSLLRNLVRKTLRSSMDHALLLPVMSKQVFYQETSEGELWKFKAKGRLTNIDADWEYKCPKGAVYPIRTVAITRDIVEQEVSRLLRHRLPESILNIEVKLREEAAEQTAAFFRFTRGLASHEGPKQRIFHGYRGRLEIFVGDERRPDLEHYVAHDIFGSSVHVATSSQIVSGDFLPGYRPTGSEVVRFSYLGSHGKFEAQIPSNKIFVVERDTSIECIAQELARIVSAKENTGSPVRVFCYEGIGKGAIAEL